MVVAQDAETVVVIFQVVRNDIHEEVFSDAKSDGAGTHFAINGGHARYPAFLRKIHYPLRFFLSETRNYILAFHSAAAQCNDVADILFAYLVLQADPITIRRKVF